MKTAIKKTVGLVFWVFGCDEMAMLTTIAALLSFVAAAMLIAGL